MRLSEKLPIHTPDTGVWQRLSAGLDAADAQVAFQEKLQQLPVHSPDPGTWNAIYFRLNKIAYYKTGVRIALSVAAGLLLFFTVYRISDNFKNRPTNSGIANNLKQTIVPDKVTASESNASQSNTIAKSNNHTQANSSKSNFSSATTEGASPVENNTVIGKSEIALNQASEIALTKENTSEPIAQLQPTHNILLAANQIVSTDIKPKIISYQKELAIISPTSEPQKKYYTPKESIPGRNKNHFALAMNYLPENINNGTNNSLFHNVDLTASYNKEKVRFNTSLGMAYNEQQLNIEMTYDINTPVTAVGPGGHIDTVSYNVASMESEYQGTEKHQYLTYNLGIGRRLFNLGKFSTWINAGAGFGVMINNPDLVSTTENSIKGQPNAQVKSIKSDKPVYNDVNINFVTGIDFSYKILNRLSLTFTPTSRWYFKPLLTKNNQATDELSLGFKTGMKFEF